MWRLRLYPFGFAIFPVLATVAKNPGLFPLREVAMVVGALAAVPLIVMAVTAVVLRSSLSWSRALDVAALVALAAVGIFYLYEPMPVGPAKLLARAHPIAAAVLLAGGVAAIAWLVRRFGTPRIRLTSVARFLSTVAAILMVWTLGRIALSTARSRWAIARSPLVASLRADVPIRRTSFTPPEAGGVAPDIYILLLDEYPSADVLRERFGFDNRPFEDSLRALGFRIPSALRSNYSITLLSVSSLLNFAHVAPIAQATGPDSRDYAPGVYLLRHNRATRFLRERGYRFVFMSSVDYGPTRWDDEATSEFDPYARFDLGRSYHRSELASSVLEHTLFDRVLPHLADQPTVAAVHAARTLEGMGSVAGSAQPTFVFAHVMMPHIPWVVDAACRPGSSHASDSVRMGEELQCLNRQTLHAVRTILARSRRPPIILLQGDHGSQSLKLFASDTALPTEAQARERFRPFGAYYLPAGGAAVIPDSTSLVNILRYVFSYYFGAELPPLPNTMYYSHWRRPYRLTALDAGFHPLASTRQTAVAR